MSKLSAYSGLTTKIRAMEGRLLGKKEFEELVTQESVPMAVIFLKQLPAYASLFTALDENELHRGEVEKRLRYSIYHDFAKLYRFSNKEQRAFLHVYFRRFEVEVIKRYMRNIFDHRDPKLDLSDFEVFFAKHSKLSLQAMSNCKTVEELMHTLSDTDYYTTIERLLKTERSGLFDYEMALDLYSFTSLWNYIEGLAAIHASAGLEKALGIKFDLLNLLWIYRCRKYYHMSAAQIYAMLTPAGWRLGKHEITQMVEAESVESLESLIGSTYYAKKYKDFDAKTMERLYAQIMSETLKRLSRNDPYSIATLYSYLHHKEHEVGRIIIALESVRYRIPPDEAMVYVHSN